MRAAEPRADAAPWADFVPSVLAHHGMECCSTARTWFLAMDRSHWQGEGGPSWISRRFPWGPSRWPLHWCEAMKADELDCGAHQALTLEAFRARGIEVVPVQLVQRHELHHVPHWHGRWGAAEASPAWASEGLAYHEACATVAGGRVEVWDSSGGAWICPRHTEGLYSIVAIRIGGPAPTAQTVEWRGVRLPLGSWVSLEREV